VPRKCGSGHNNKKEEVMRKNRCMEAVIRELRQAGIDFQIEHGSKHPRICFVLNSRRQFYVVPFSTSTRNSHKDGRAGIRRMLRQQQINGAQP
jgi:hypothetical protein